MKDNIPGYGLRLETELVGVGKYIHTTTDFGIKPDDAGKVSDKTLLIHERINEQLLLDNPELSKLVSVIVYRGLENLAIADQSPVSADVSRNSHVVAL